MTTSSSTDPSPSLAIRSSAIRSSLASLGLVSAIGLTMVGTTMSAEGVSEAKPKKKNKVATACGISFLPFVEGRSWKYQYVIPPNASEDEKPLKTKLPETFTITVKSVEQSKSGATITLEEKYRESAHKTVLTCTGSKLDVPMSSFFYLGELPGGLQMEVSNLDVQGPMYPGSAGLKKGVSYYAKIKAKVSRPAAGETAAKHLPATLEMERQLTVGNKEKIEVDHGPHNAYGVEFAISGRISLESTPDKKVFLPDGVAKLWFADGVGVVRAYNRMEEGWALVEMTDQ